MSKPSQEPNELEAQPSFSVLLHPVPVKPSSRLRLKDRPRAKDPEHPSHAELHREVRWCIQALILRVNQGREMGKKYETAEQAFSYCTSQLGAHPLNDDLKRCIGIADKALAKQL